MVVPGAAVRSYVRPAVQRASAAGWSIELAAAPGSPDAPTDLGEYGRELAGCLARRPVDLLVGLSVGAQAAAVAATAVEVPRLALVGPTVDPACRSTPRLLARWLAGGRLESARLLPAQLPDWRRAGRRRLMRLVRSALAVELERVLPRVDTQLTVVHAERDVITSHSYAAQLATGYDAGQLLVLPGATHSWPYGDPDGFVTLLDRLLR